MHMNTVIKDRLEARLRASGACGCLCFARFPLPLCSCFLLLNALGTSGTPDDLIQEFCLEKLDFPTFRKQRKIGTSISGADLYLLYACTCACAWLATVIASATIACPRLCTRPAVSLMLTDNLGCALSMLLRNLSLFRSLGSNAMHAYLQRHDVPPSSRRRTVVGRFSTCIRRHLDVGQSRAGLG